MLDIVFLFNIAGKVELLSGDLWRHAPGITQVEAILWRVLGSGRSWTWTRKWTIEKKYVCHPQKRIYRNVPPSYPK
jgi:hypothetical protein